MFIVQVKINCISIIIGKIHENRYNQYKSTCLPDNRAGNTLLFIFSKKMIAN